MSNAWADSDSELAAGTFAGKDNEKKQRRGHHRGLLLWAIYKAHDYIELYSHTGSREFFLMALVVRSVSSKVNMTYNHRLLEAMQDDGWHLALAQRNMPTIVLVH